MLRVIFFGIFLTGVVMPLVTYADTTKCSTDSSGTDTCITKDASGNVVSTKICTTVGDLVCNTYNADGTQVRIAIDPNGGILTTNKDTQGNLTDSYAGPGKIIMKGAVKVFTYALEWLGKLTAEGLSWVGVQLMLVLIWLVGLVLGMVGFLFDFVVNQLVLGMGKYINSSSAAGIQIAWTIMRDLANIGIIGGLVAAAFGTILNLSKINAKTLLARLIVAALLVNFSYFFAAAMIDVSNFTAGVIYKSAVATAGCKDCSIATTFIELTEFKSVQGLGYVVGTLFQPLTGVEPKSLGFTSNVTDLFEKIMFLILMCVTLYVFLSAIALLIGRFVALILLLISSPLGIAGLAIPGLQTYAKEWWKALFSQALFAPVYFLLVGISLKILSGLLGAIKTALSTNGSVSTMGIVISFLIATIFMLLSLRAAKAMSEQAKSLASVYKATGAVSGFVGKFGSGVGFRNTVGRVADTGYFMYKDWAAKNENGRLMGVLKATGGDLAIQGGLGWLRDKKIFGYEGRHATKTERQKRDAELVEEEKKIQQFKDLRGKLPAKDWDDLNALFRKARTKGLSDEDQKKFNKLAGILDKDEQERLNKLEEAEEEGELEEKDKPELEKLRGKDKRAGALGQRMKAELRHLEEFKKGTKRQKVTGKNDKTRLAELLKKQEEQGGELKDAVEKEELADLQELAKTRELKDGAERIETWREFWKRQKTRGEEGMEQQKDKEGNLIEGRAGMEDLNGYKERLDKLGLQGNKLQFREARSATETIFQTLPEGFLEEEYYKNPKSITPLATALPEELYLTIMKDPKISRKIKNQMTTDRFQQWAQWVKEIAEDETVAPGSLKHKTRLNVPYEYASKYIRPKELEVILRSNAVFDEDSGMRFEQLLGKKYLDTTMNAMRSSQFMALKASGIFGTTAQRDVNAAKRKDPDKTRDRYHAANDAFGFDGGPNGDQDFVPDVAGEVDLHGAKRVDLAAKKSLKTMGRIIKLAKDDPDAVESEDLALAEDEVAFWGLVQTAKQDKAKQKSLLDAIGFEKEKADVRTREEEEMKQEGLTDAEIEKEITMLGRAQAIRKTRESYQKELTDIAREADDAVREEKTKKLLARDEILLIHNQIVAEEGAADWYLGKNPDEIEAILNKRSWWSKTSVFGILGEQFNALRKQDGNERAAFFRNYLMRGDDSWLASYATNDNLRASFSWPAAKEVREINRVRRAFGRENLPESFVREKIEKIVEIAEARTKTKKTGEGPPPEPDDDGDGEDDGTPTPTPTSPRTSGPTGTAPGIQPKSVALEDVNPTYKAWKTAHEAEYSGLGASKLEQTWRESREAVAVAERELGARIEETATERARALRKAGGAFAERYDAQTKRLVGMLEETGERDAEKIKQISEEIGRIPDVILLDTIALEPDTFKNVGFSQSVRWHTLETILNSPNVPFETKSTILKNVDRYGRPDTKEWLGSKGNDLINRYKI